MKLECPACRGSFEADDALAKAPGRRLCPSCSHRAPGRPPPLVPRPRQPTLRGAAAPATTSPAGPSPDRQSPDSARPSRGRRPKAPELRFSQHPGGEPTPLNGPLQSPEEPDAPISFRAGAAPHKAPADHPSDSEPLTRRGAELTREPSIPYLDPDDIAFDITFEEPAAPSSVVAPAAPTPRVPTSPPAVAPRRPNFFEVDVLPSPPPRSLADAPPPARPAPPAPTPSARARDSVINDILHLVHSGLGSRKRRDSDLVRLSGHLFGESPSRGLHPPPLPPCPRTCRPN